MSMKTMALSLLLLLLVYLNLISEISCNCQPFIIKNKGKYRNDLILMNPEHCKGHQKGWHWLIKSDHGKYGKHGSDLILMGDNGGGGQQKKKSFFSADESRQESRQSNRQADASNQPAPAFTMPSASPFSMPSASPFSMPTSPYFYRPPMMPSPFQSAFASNQMYYYMSPYSYNPFRYRYFF